MNLVLLISPTKCSQGGQGRSQFCNRHLCRDPRTMIARCGRTPWRSPGFSFGGPLSPAAASECVRVHPSPTTQKWSRARSPPLARRRPNPLGGQPQVVTRMACVDAFSAFIDAMAGGRICVKRTHISVGQTKMKRRQAERPTEQRFR